VKRSRTGGKGLDGVTEKDAKYLNPFIELMLNR
jgi:beta-lysine 5,6-aminomutase alpha subunit